jgi:hypothetical protein
VAGHDHRHLRTLAAGRGTDAARREITDVVERFQQALGDAERACARLTAATRDQLKGEEQQPCARAILEHEHSLVAVMGTIWFATSK